VLDGAVVAVVALIAGADGWAAARLGVAMTSLQFAIGALNDLIDAPREMNRLDKPIPGGLVRPLVARSVVVGGVAAGLWLSALSGAGTVVVALAGLGAGLAYDLRLKGTPWSWLPFAVGIPILPVYGWIGATGMLPALFLALLPAAVLAGTALALSNARADIERDTAAGTRSVATTLGERRAWVVHAVLFTVVVAIALGSLAVRASSAVWIVGAIAASLVIGIGVGLGWRSDPERRERAWEIEAVGTGLLAAAWLAAMVAAGPG
jgi:4-hydroxybenzoate polyprenyltransferase